jgi:hypothetical protein
VAQEGGQNKKAQEAMRIKLREAMLKRIEDDKIKIKR